MPTVVSSQWHPFLVHFPLAYWLLGSLIMLAAALFNKERWAGFAWLCLILGALTSLPAVLAGQHDFAALTATPAPNLLRHRALGNALPWLMLPLAALWLHFRLKQRAFSRRIWPWVGPVLVIAALIVYIAYLGGVSVWIDGLTGP